MQIQELQIKKQDSDTNAKKVMLDAAAKADAQKLREQEVSGRLQLDALKVGAQIKESQAKTQFEQERAGVQMGADIAKNKAQLALQNRTAVMQHINQNQPKGSTSK
jgi:hypothetical protein